jgi:hypothetical protein
MHYFIIQCLQFGEFLPEEELRTIVEIAPLADPMSDGSMAEVVHQRADRRFAEEIEQLGKVHFVNLIVDASEPPVLLALREN